MLGNVTLILVCDDLPAGDPRELAACCAPSRRLLLRLAGAGTAHHLLVELIRSARMSQRCMCLSRFDEGLVDPTEGRFDFMFLDATVALSQIAAGKLKALA